MNKYSYRVDENEGKMPDGDSVVVQASDPVENRSVFEFRIKHGLKRDEFGVARRGFVASIKAGGLANTDGTFYFGEDGVAYGQAVASGFLIIERKVQEVSGLAVAAM